LKSVVLEKLLLKELNKFDYWKRRIKQISSLPFRSILFKRLFKILMVKALWWSKEHLLLLKVVRSWITPWILRNPLIILWQIRVLRIYVTERDLVIILIQDLRLSLSKVKNITNWRCFTNCFSFFLESSKTNILCLCLFIWFSGLIAWAASLALASIFLFDIIHWNWILFSPC